MKQKRKMTQTIALLLLFLLGSHKELGFSEEPKALTLEDCYTFALKQSETIAIKQEVIKEAEGQFLSSISGMMPDVMYSYSDKRQNGSNDNNFSLSSIPEGKFVFSQSLFSGFKEFASIAVGKAELRRRKQDVIRAKQLLFTDVSDAFYFFMNYQENLKALDTIRTALMNQLDELKKREELGRSRASEVANAEARISRVDADMEMLLSQQEVARQLLEFLTGQTIGILVDPDFDLEPKANQSEYYDKAALRPDVKSAYEAWKSAKGQITIAKSELWPAVGLDGDYYTKRVGNGNSVDWDVTLKVDVPIFNGTEDFGKVKSAKSVSNQAELLYNQTKRNALLEIKNAYTNLEASIKRTAALSRALKAAEKNYDLQMEDFRLNLVNNLVVLQALEDLEDIRREYVAVKNEAKRAYWNLKVTTGEITHDAF